MNKVCNFCLEFNTPLFEINNIDINHVMKTVFPTKDINSFKNAVICVECLSSLKSSYDFTRSARESHSKICAAAIKNDDLCQTCIKPVKNGAVYLFDHFENVIPYYEIKEMLDYSSLDLDVENCQCPVICHTCWNKLNKSYNFLKRFAENERRMKPLNIRNSIAKSNYVQIEERKQLSSVMPEIKVEFDEERIKQEHLDDMATENDLLETLAEHDECFDRGVMNNVVYVKEGRSDKAFEKKLYIKLDKLNFDEVDDREHKKSKKAKLMVHKCRLCPFTTWKRYTYNLHKTTHMTLEECAKTNTLFRCNDCTYRTKRRYSLIRHMREVHRLAYVCEKCGYETNIAESFKLHLETEHNNNLVSYPCKQCPYICLTKVKLHQHAKMHDLQNIVLKCSLCTFETKEMVKLHEHRMCHKDMKTGKLYKCEKCSYQVKKKSSIDRHVLTHFTRKQLTDKLHTCHECLFKTKRKDTLANHIRNKHKKKYE